MIQSGLSDLAVQWKIKFNPDSSREVVEVCLKNIKKTITIIFYLSA